MKLKRPSFVIGLSLWLASPSFYAAEVDFDKDVAVLLARRCFDCHSGAEPKGGLDLSRKKSAFAGGDNGPVLVPGNPEKSKLWKWVSKERMPPKKPLSAVEKEIIRTWIAAGATWGTDPIDPFRVSTDKRAGYDWWSLQPVVRPKPPAVKNTLWQRNPLDAFVLAKLEAAGLNPSAEADRRTLIRRLSFDLLGLPPRPEAVEKFVQDPAADAYEKLVDQFLGSPQYGVRWARHWLDIVRFGESNGFEFDEFRSNAWPYRDWVVDAFNRDLPFDQFVRLQIAGDVLHPNEADAVRATGFLVAGAFDSAGQSQQSEIMRKVVRQDELEDITGVVGQTFLGLTVNCARCHDHEFDPIKQVEYYRLTSALAGVRHGERDLPIPDKNRDKIQATLSRLRQEIQDIESTARKSILLDRNAHPVPAPKPMAAWDFKTDLNDTVGKLHGTGQENPIIKDGLRVDGKSYVTTAALNRDLKAKTLEAWVTIGPLDQRGGGVISVQTKNGEVFDAIVFAEQEPGQWLAGSNGFVRTKPLKGSVEKSQVPVQMVLVYSEDGKISAYRNGQPYGEPYQSTGLKVFKVGECQVVFGMRHGPAGGNKMLRGTIHKARLYDRALSPAEVAASAGAKSDFISTEEILAKLTPEQRNKRKQCLDKVSQEEMGLHSKLYAVTPRPPGPTYFLQRGNTATPGDKVAPGGVGALVGVSSDFGLNPDAPEADGRKKLADWITHPKNPLFYRVAVNRLWHYHFGVGLLDTPNDFGFNGGRPSHPELLDWLAAELREQKGSLKKLHRVIVLSATYRQVSRNVPDSAKVDAANRLLWRKSPVRLEAEAVRDSMLAVAGKLDLRLGGPGFQEYQAVKAEGTNTFLYQLVEPPLPDFNRRTLFRTWARGGRSRLLDVLDCPDPSTTSPSRVVTTTPLQALALLNNAFVLRQAGAFANRITQDVGKNIDRQIKRAYALAYGRDPQDEELAQARKAVSEHGLAVLTRAILNSNEFLYVD